MSNLGFAQVPVVTCVPPTQVREPTVKLADLQKQPFTAIIKQHLSMNIIEELDEAQKMQLFSFCFNYSVLSIYNFYFQASKLHVCLRYFSKIVGEAD